MKNRWYDLYYNDIQRNFGYKNYYNRKIRYRGKLIKKIEKYAFNKKVLEAGCGTGVFSIKLADLGYESYALDIDKDMLQIVEKISKEVGTNVPKMVQCDIFNLSNRFNNKLFDVTFSIGVYEHFDDKEIKLLLMEQNKISNYIFVGVPTRYFNENEKLYGNERFLPYSYWRRIFKENNFSIIEEFNLYNQNLLKRIINIKKWFRPAPIRVFVIKSL